MMPRSEPGRAPPHNPSVRIHADMLPRSQRATLQPERVPLALHHRRLRPPCRSVGASPASLEGRTPERRRSRLPPLEGIARWCRSRATRATDRTGSCCQRLIYGTTHSRCAAAGMVRALVTTPHSRCTLRIGRCAVFSADHEIRRVSSMDGARDARLPVARLWRVRLAGSRCEGLHVGTPTSQEAVQRGTPAVVLVSVPVSTAGNDVLERGW